MERVSTHLSSGVRTTETPDPANCAFCQENYYSVCPAQGTKGPCEGAASSARHREARPCPVRPSPGRLLHPPASCQGFSPEPALEQAGGVARNSPATRPVGLREMPSSASAKWQWPVCGEWGTRRVSLQTAPHPGHEGVTRETHKSSGGQGDSLPWGSGSYGLGRGRNTVVPEKNTKGLPCSWSGDWNESEW